MHPLLHFQLRKEKVVISSPDASKDTVTEETINISTSDWDSEAMKIFHPETVRKNLLKLAKDNPLLVKNKPKVIERMQNFCENCKYLCI